MRILDYKKANKDGNIQGYLSIALDVAVEGNMLQLMLDVTLIRNSITGDLFVSWPSRSFVNEQGQTKYAPQMRWPKEQLDYIQKVILNEFMKMNRGSIPPQAPSAITHRAAPHHQPSTSKFDGCPF